MSDTRATQIARWIKSGEMTADALRAIAYLIQKMEYAGDLEIFVSDEIDSHAESKGE